MKILLIQPPVRDFYQTAIRTQPIGLAYLAASLEDHGFAVEILDCQITSRKEALPLPNKFSFIQDHYPRGDLSPLRLFSHYCHFGLSYREIEERMRQSRADVIGISSQFTPYCEEAGAIASLAKKIDAACPVIMGGAHVSAAPEHVLRHPAVDYIIPGEGEHALPLLVRCLAEGRSAHELGGVGYRVNGAVRINPGRTIPDVDAISFPARHLLDLPRYTIRGRPYTVLITSRGCPQGCTYCSVAAVMGTAYRPRSAENVLAEVKHCTEKYGISLFDIEDDNFTLDPQRALRILQLLIEEFGENTLQLFAMNGLSIFSLNRELLEQMKRAGFHHLDLSLGSAARRASTLINRPYKPEQATAVLRQAADCNLPATTYIIYGIPGHSKEEMVHSLCYLMGQEALIGPSIFYPTPGTPVYRELYGGHHAPDFTALRSSLFPVETGEFSRLDLITLLRLSRWINSVKQIPLPALTKKQLSLGELREVSVTNWLPAQLREPGQTVFSVPQPAAVTAAGAAKIMTAVVLHRNSLWGLKRLRPLQQRTPAYEIFPYQSSRMVLQLFWDHAESVPVRCVRK